MFEPRLKTLGAGSLLKALQKCAKGDMGALRAECGGGGGGGGGGGAAAVAAGVAGGRAGGIPELIARLSNETTAHAAATELRNLALNGECRGGGGGGGARRARGARGGLLTRAVPQTRTKSRSLLRAASSR